ncbi:HTH-type transcriptional regulator YofA [compost metagenome]
MLTLKQIEAVYWVSSLGGFYAAAERLNATQSTISKRILDLESFLGVEIFEQKNRAQLTLKGRELLGDFEKMLELQNSVVRRVGNDSSYSGRFRLGVTEMVALSWLPALIRAVRHVYPQIVLEPKVDRTTQLWPQMTSHRLDMVICPQMHAEDHSFQTVQLGFMESAWMCRPDLLDDRKGGLPIEDVLRLPLLTYSEGSLLHQRLLTALTAARIWHDNTIVCNSMIALAELASAGLGVTYLPREYFSSYIESGNLRAIQTSLLLPPLEYTAVHRSDAVSLRIAEIAREVCDFGRPQWQDRIAAPARGSAQAARASGSSTA